MENIALTLATETLENIKTNGSPVIVGGTVTLKEANNGKSSTVHFFSSSSGSLEVAEKTNRDNLFTAKLQNKPGASAEDKAQCDFSKFAGLANKQPENFEDICNCKHIVVLSTPEVNAVTNEEESKRAFTVLASNDFNALMSHIQPQVEQVALINNSDELDNRWAGVLYSFGVDGQPGAFNLLSEQSGFRYDYSKSGQNLNLVGNTIKAMMDESHREFSQKEELER